MLKATDPDQETIRYRGKVYRIEDAFPSAEMAVDAAENARRNIDRGHYIRAVTVDLGKNAGRLRYAIFVVKGRKA